MLRTADRYLAWTVAVTVVVVLVCFVTLTASFALAEEVREEEAAYGFRDAFAYVLHTLPRRVDHAGQNARGLDTCHQAHQQDGEHRDPQAALDAVDHEAASGEAL